MAVSVGSSVEIAKWINYCDGDEGSKNVREEEVTGM